MVKAGTGAARTPVSRTSSTDLRLEDLEFELRQTREQLAESQATERRYNLQEGAGADLAGKTAEEVREGAAKLMAEMEASGNNKGQRYEELAQMAQTGGPYVKPNFLQKALGATQIPFRLVRAAALDFLQVDKRAGFEMDFSKDVWDIFGQNEAALAERNEPFSAPGALSDNAFNTAAIWKSTGAYNSPFMPKNKFARGTMHFLADMGGDPVNYATFGGAGVAKSTIATAARSILREGMEEAVEQGLRGAAREAGDLIAVEAAERAARRGNVITEAMEAARKAGGSVEEAASAARQGLAKEIANEMEAEVLKPLLVRDFGQLPTWFAKSQRMKDTAPYLQGGIRFTGFNPLSSGQKGRAAVGRGAGRTVSRAILGNRAGTRGDEAARGLAGKLEKLGVFDKVDTAAAAIGMEKRIIDSARLGTVQGVRQSDVLSGGVRASRERLGTRNKELVVNQSARAYGQAMKSASADQILETNKAIIDGIQSGAFRGGDAVLPDFLDDAQELAARAFADEFTETMQFMRRQASDLGIDMGNQENYVPLIWDQDFNSLLQRFADNAVGIDPEDYAEELKPAMTWLSEAVAAREHRGIAGGSTALGESGYTRQRHLGKEVTVRDVNGVTILDGAPGVDVTFARHGEMSDAIFTAAQRIARENNMSFRSATQTALEQDPIKLMNKYFRSMDDALVERDLVRQLRAVGSITDGTFETDVGRLLAETVENVKSPRVQGLLQAKKERIMTAARKTADEWANPYQETRAVSMGPFGKVELPARATRVNDPRLQKYINEAQIKSKAYSRANTSLRREQQHAVERLTAQGVPEHEAMAIASSSSRGELKAAARRARDLTIKEARQDSEDLFDVVRRMEASIDDKLAARDRAVKAANQAYDEVERAAAKSEAKVHKEIVNEMRNRRAEVFAPVRFSGEARESLHSTFTRDLGTVLADLEHDLGDEAAGIFDNLLNALETGEGVGEALTEALSVGRRQLPELAGTLNQREIDRLRGLALEAGAKLRKHEMINKEAMEALRVAPDQGEQSLFELVRRYENEVSSRYGRLVRANPKASGAVAQQIADSKKALDEMREILDVLEESTARIPPHWQVTRMLEGTELAGELRALRHIDLEQNVMRDASARQGLERLLRRAGMIGDEVELAANRSAPMGFELLDRTARYTDDLDDPMWGRLGVYSDQIDELQESVRTAVQRRIGDVADAETSVTGAVRQATLLRRLNDDVLRVLKKKTATLEELVKAGERFRRMRGDFTDLLAPADQPMLDLVGEHVERLIALESWSQATNPNAVSLLDSASNLRRQYFDTEAAANSLRELAEKVHGEQMLDMHNDQLNAVGLIQQMEEKLRRLLAVGTDADGQTVRGFQTPEIQEEMSELLDMGGKAWRKLDLPENADPFDVKGLVPTSRRPRFVSPENYGLGGVLRSSEQIDRYAGEWLENAMGVMATAHQPENMKALAQKARTLQNWWKASATVARPSFHVRNVIGGLWNGMYADVGMNDYGVALANTQPFLNALRRTSSVDEALEVVSTKARPYYRAAWDVGLFDDTFASTELAADTLRQIKKRSKLNPMSVDGPLVKAGGVAMESLEGHMRMGVFIRHFNPDAQDVEQMGRLAKSWVDAVHFNYADLTKIEENVKQFVPFFVWFRRNLPLQMRMLIENPRMINRYQHLITAVDGQSDDVPDDDLPGNVYRAGTMYADVGRLNADSPFWSKVLFDPDLPINVFEDFNTNPFSVISMLANQLGPQFDLIKLASNDEDYRITAPGGISQLLNVMPDPVAGALGAEKNPYGVPRLSPRAGQLWRLAFPQVGEYGSVLEQAPNRRQGLGQLPITEVEDEQDSALSDASAFAWRTLGRGLGFQLEGVDDAYSAATQARFDIQGMRTELRKQGLVTPEGEAAVENADARAEIEALLSQLDSGE